MIYSESVISKYLLWASLAAMPTISVAQDVETKSGAFSVGSVAMMCTAPKDREIAEWRIEKALPRWMEVLQALANEGVVVRAHNLKKPMDGIFIIIAGDGPQDALNNAVLASYQLSQIFVDVTGIKNFNNCTYTQLGPVAVLPIQQR